MSRTEAERLALQGEIRLPHNPETFAAAKPPCPRRVGRNGPRRPHPKKRDSSDPVLQRALRRNGWKCSLHIHLLTSGQRPDRPKVSWVDPPR